MEIVKRIFWWFRLVFFIAAGLTALLLVMGMGSAFLPLFTFRSLSAGIGKTLGTDEICAALLRGDYEAASAPIALKTAKRRLRLGEIIVWLGGKEESPYFEIPGSMLFTELPADLGPVRSCGEPSEPNLAGDELSATLTLGFDGYRVPVTLRYSAGLFSRRLQRIEIRSPELVTPSTPPPGEDERRMADFIQKLDKMSGEK